MVRVAAALVYVSLALAQDRGTLFLSGPFEVYAMAGERPAREVLNKLEQFRHAFGTLLGQPDAASIWPIRVWVVRPQRDAKAAALAFARDHWEMTVSSANSVDAGILKQLGRIFLEANAAPMPEWVDRGLLDLFSTLEVSGTRVTLGAPPPERSRDWARMHMLAVHPDYSGKLRVLLANLQRGADLEPSFRNAFEKSPAEVEKQLDGYLAAGVFGAIPLSGKPLQPDRDFEARPAPPPDKRPPSAADLLEAGDLAGAARANPRWAEPIYRLALKETDPEKRLAGIKKAIALEPRNPRYREALAQAVEQNRLALEEAERRRKEEARLELERLRDEALRRIREAELRANEGKPRVDESKVVPWWDGPQPTGHVEGMLQRVDCIGGMLRLVVAPPGAKPVQLMIRNPSQVVLEGGGTSTLACGPQKPPRRIAIQYFPQADAKLGTTGEVAVVEFK